MLTRFQNIFKQRKTPQETDTNTGINNDVRN